MMGPFWNCRSGDLPFFEFLASYCDYIKVVGNPESEDNRKCKFLRPSIFMMQAVASALLRSFIFDEAVLRKAYPNDHQTVCKIRLHFLNDCMSLDMPHPVASTEINGPLSHYAIHIRIVPGMFDHKDWHIRH